MPGSKGLNDGHLEAARTDSRVSLTLACLISRDGSCPDGISARSASDESSLPGAHFARPRRLALSLLPLGVATPERGTQEEPWRNVAGISVTPSPGPFVCG